MLLAKPALGCTLKIATFNLVGVLHLIKILKHAELATETTFPAIISRLWGMFSYAMLRMWMRPDSFNEALHSPDRDEWMIAMQ